MFQALDMDSISLPSDLKYANRVRLIQAFLDLGKASAGDIAQDIGLSRQTAMKAIRHFQRSGLLVSAGKGESTTIGGKRPEQFGLSGRRYFVCITMWPGEMAVSVFTIGHEPVASTVCMRELPHTAIEAVRAVGEMATSLLAEKQIDKADVCAVSLSTSGVVDKKAGVLRYSSNSPEWGTNLPIRDYLLEHFERDTLIFIENAGKMTARPFGADPGLSNKRILVVFASWGLSSCLIERNHILNGRNALIGEIGHMMIDPEDTEKCGCGSHGCLERLVSMERLRKRAGELQGKYPDSCLLTQQREAFSIRDVFRASASGDELAQKLIGKVAETFASALRNISLVFDPDLVVFQGDYAYADALFDRLLRKSLGSFKYFPNDTPFDICYDQRDISEMNMEGSYLALVNEYFSSQRLYLDTDGDEE